MRILFAIGIAVSALLLTSCSNPDTSGGVTMQKADVGDGDPNNAPFPNGSCDTGLRHWGTDPTGCGSFVSQNADPEISYYIKPNADLSGADLSGANLKVMDTCLVGANLSSANLTGANLRYADLSFTSLTGATLSGVRANAVTRCPNGKYWGTTGNNCGF